MEWLLWPVGLCLLVLLVQLVFILASVLECLTLIRYEILPALKDVRLTAAHVEDLSGRVATGGQVLHQSIRSGRFGVQALVSGLGRAFRH
jgi:hypothetical protein